jgi:hypothetical protein
MLILYQVNQGSDNCSGLEKMWLLLGEKTDSIINELNEKLIAQDVSTKPYCWLQRKGSTRSFR